MDRVSRHDVNRAAENFRPEFADVHELQEAEAARLIVVKQVDIGVLGLLRPRH
jgi:hypothetical protein